MWRSWESSRDWEDGANCGELKEPVRGGMVSGMFQWAERRYERSDERTGVPEDRRRKRCHGGGG